MSTEHDERIKGRVSCWGAVLRHGRAFYYASLQFCIVEYDHGYEECDSLFLDEISSLQICTLEVGAKDVMAYKV